MKNSRPDNSAFSGKDLKRLRLDALLDSGRITQERWAYLMGKTYVRGSSSRARSIARRQIQRAVAELAAGRMTQAEHDSRVAAAHRAIAKGIPMREARAELDAAAAAASAAAGHHTSGGVADPPRTATAAPDATAKQARKDWRRNTKAAHDAKRAARSAGWESYTLPAPWRRADQWLTAVIRPYIRACPKGTARDLAKLLGLDTSTFSKIISGRRQPSQEIIDALAKWHARQIEQET